LMRHVEYLRSRWAEQLKTVILGLPRLKSAAGALLRESPCTPTDSEQLLAVATFNLFDRFALPFVNTRERWGQCVAMAAGGGTLFTLNCKTIPGGYTQAQAGYQFPTYDYGEKAYLRELEARGITPIFDWSFESLPRATRLIESGVLCP